LAAGLRTRRRDAIGTTLFLGAFIVVMLPISPMCHIHYFIFAMPLVIGLLAAMWERTPFPQVERGYMLLFGANIALNALSALPGFQSWKDFGVTLGAALLLWGAGIHELVRTPAPQVNSIAKD
jgi:4-hydroxybenzoate polyprenyltransferase